MKENLELFLNTLCEVKTMKNELLFYGKVNRIIEDKMPILEIFPTDEEENLPLLPYDTPVKAVLRKNDQMMVIGGNIYIGNKEFWRISNITEFQNFERRGFFRVSAAVSGLVSPAKKDSIETEEEPSYPAKLINISLSGVMFTADHNFQKTDLLQLHSLIMLDGKEAFMLLCKIVAKEEAEGFDFRYQYRCQFEEMSDRNADLLCKAIFELERESIKKMRNRTQ